MLSLISRFSEKIYEGCPRPVICQFFRSLSQPMQKQINRTTTQRIARVTIKVILFLFMFLILVFLFLFTPPGQHFAKTRIESYLRNKLHTRVEIGSMSIGLPNKVILHNVYLEDQVKDTLLSGGTIKTDLDLFKLFSNEVNIHNMELDDVTAKVKRILPDTVFNFQFIVDAFLTDKTKKPDTATTAVMKLDIRNLLLNNFNVVYNDVITGNDMHAHVNYLKANIDTLDPYKSHYAVPSVSVNGMKMRFYQHTPLVKPQTYAEDMARVGKPVPMDVQFGSFNLKNVDIDYGNDVSAFYTKLLLGDVLVENKDLDLTNRNIHLANLQMKNTNSAIRLGRQPGARVLASEVKKEVKVQQQNGWTFSIDKTVLANNTISYDNDNTPKQPHGIDYAHFSGTNINLDADRFIMKGDSVSTLVNKASFREKSGFQLDDLHADILYASNLTAIRNLYLKTPGTELKRNFIMEYASPDALSKQFDQTVFDVELVNSHVQVKDILAFAPQLRNNPAFRNVNDIWSVNIVGNGTPNRLNFETLQFNGLKNTSIDAHGTLAGLMRPTSASGTFTINKLYTSQTDIALFTGSRLSTRDINLPENFNISGTVSGNMNQLNTNLNIATAFGNAGINGSLSNLTDPAKFRYNANVSTRSLRLDLIMRNKVPIGALSANMRFNGSGLTPASINTKFNGKVYSVVYNRYNYRNLTLNGSLHGSLFNVNADIRDPNIDLTAKARGKFAANTSFKIVASVDSIKTMPLHFTTEPLIFHGNVDADVASLNADYLDANVLVTDGLFVSGIQRLPVDTMQFVSGHNGSNQFMRLTSNVINADIEGQYRLSDLGYIIQNNIQPYFTVSKSSKVYNVKPYDFTFRADIANSPFLSAFVPGLNILEPVHAEGSLATGRGLNANLSAASLVYQQNTVQNLNLKINTTAQGLVFTGTAGHLINGNTFNVYNTTLRATALNNVIDFNLAIADKNAKGKYTLNGTVNQPSTGTYVLHLRPDSLLLNYDHWTVSADNELIYSPGNIGARNFTLAKGNQEIRLQSVSGTSGPLETTFTNFRIATITGFMRTDSILADGVMNGTVTFRNLLQQPLFTSNLAINDLSFRGDTVGNVNLQVSSNAANRYTITSATVTGRGNDIILSGSLAPSGEKDIALDIDMNIRKMELHTFEGALKSAITKADGSIDGNVKITGTTASPDVKGQIHFNDTRFTTVLLGGEFTVRDETLAIGNDGLRFNNFSIRDSAGSPLTLDGNIQTSNFINYFFNLDVTANNFRILSTTKKQHKIYWGNLYVSTNMHLAGTEQKPIIDGSVVVEDKTNLTVVIPQKEPGVEEREGVIQFVDMNARASDSLFLASYDSLNVSTLVGYDISANIEIKKEAVLSMVIDEANGDLLNLQGEALLTGGIDPSGKVTLTGSYVLDKGAYELSFNFLHRRFEIEKGSTLVWLGEPTRATLDVTGVYIANAAPIDLVQSQLEASTGALRNTYFLQKLPFEVYLKVTGEMMKPVVSFDIVLPPEKSYTVSKEVIQLVDARLSQLREEPSEVNKQVFSLLLLNRFVGENPFQSSASGFTVGSFARQSVSELLTDQLNNLAGGLIQGVDVNFGVVSSDDYTTGALQHRTDLNVGLSKRLLNDRLAVSIGSNFELSGPQNSSNQRASNFAGDVAVNYKLSKDGRYMLRFYRRNEYQGVVEGYIIETGLGFSINVDYDHFREVIRGKKTKLEGVDDKQKPID
jgi:translocation and assembly module TamB